MVRCMLARLLTEGELGVRPSSQQEPVERNHRGSPGHRPRCAVCPETKRPARVRVRLDSELANDPTIRVEPWAILGATRAVRGSTDNDPVTQRRLRLPEILNPRRATCLGCEGQVVLRRDAHCRIAGTRDGVTVVVLEAEPLLAYATDVDRVFQPGLLLLGVAHRNCVPLARSRLESRSVELPDDLPNLIADDGAGDIPQLHLPPMPGTCAFCNGHLLEEEHVWGRWVSRELRQHGGFVVQTDHGPRPRSSIDFTSPVCGACNNEWLSVLENDVKAILSPMIRATGGSKDLSVDDQGLLATWAAKTAMMIDLHSGTPFIPTGYFHELRLRRSALPSQVVWLGAYRGTRLAVWAKHRGLRLGGSEDQAPLGFATTFTVHRVVFQVVGHFSGGAATFQDRRSQQFALHAIWPTGRQPIRWPRGGLAFNDDALAALEASIADEATALGGQQ